jgi:UDP-glucose 4-epimerase
MEYEPASGEIYNVGSTNRIRILDLAERVKGLTGSDSPLVHVPYEHVFGQGIEDMLHRSPAIDKIRGAIGWEPERELDTILRDVIGYHETAPAEFEEPAPADVV